MKIANKSLCLSIYYSSKLPLRHNDDEDLLVQLDVFEEQRLEDDEELSSPEGVNLTSHLDVFHALFRKVIIYHLPFLAYCFRCFCLRIVFIPLLDRRRSRINSSKCWNNRQIPYSQEGHAELDKCPEDGHTCN